MHFFIFHKSPTISSVISVDISVKIQYRTTLVLYWEPKGLELTYGDNINFQKGDLAMLF